MAFVAEALHERDRERDLVPPSRYGLHSEGYGYGRCWLEAIHEFRVCNIGVRKDGKRA